MRTARSLFFSLLTFAIFIVFNIFISLYFSQIRIMLEIIFSLALAIFVFFFLTFQDRAAQLVTEKAKELKASEIKYHTIVNSLNVGIYRDSLDERGSFSGTNPALVKMFGFESQEELEKTGMIERYENTEDRNRLMEILKKEGTTKNFKVKMKKKNGSVFLASITSTVHKNDKGDFDWVDGLVEDVTLVEQYTTEMKRHNEELEKTNNLMIGRELKMTQLKQENEDLKNKLGIPI